MEWASRHLWVGRRRRIGLSYWSTPCGPVLAGLLGEWRPPAVERYPGGFALRIPLTRICLSSYSRKS